MYLLSYDISASESCFYSSVQKCVANSGLLLWTARAVEGIAAEMWQRLQTGAVWKMKSPSRWLTALLDSKGSNVIRFFDLHNPAK
jgi:hypothetical protein